MNSALVSVIIPVFNTSPYLVEALESVVNQTYSNLEIIVVDDGSTDSSGDICDKYASKDPRVKVLHQTNQGLSAARNAGLDCMTGDVVAFLDADDAFHPEMIQRMLDVMNNMSADIVVCKRELYDTTGCMNPPSVITDNSFEVFDRNEALRALVEGRLLMNVWNKLYRRECFDNIRFPVGYVYEDIDTTYRLMNSVERVVMVDASLVMYRKRKGSITVDYTVDSAKDRNRAYTHLAEFVKENVPEIFSEEQAQIVYRNRFAGTLGTFLRCGRYEWSYREKVLDAAKDVDVEQCDVMTRIKWFLFCHCTRAAVWIWPWAWAVKRSIVRMRKR